MQVRLGGIIDILNVAKRGPKRGEAVLDGLVVHFVVVEKLNNGEERVRRQRMHLEDVKLGQRLGERRGLFGSQQRALQHGRINSPCGSRAREPGARHALAQVDNGGLGHDVGEEQRGIAPVDGRRVALVEDLEAVLQDGLEPRLLLGRADRVAVDLLDAVLLALQQGAAADGREDDALVERRQHAGLRLGHGLGQERPEQQRAALELGLGARQPRADDVFVERDGPVVAHAEHVVEEIRHPEDAALLLEADVICWHRRVLGQVGVGLVELVQLHQLDHAKGAAGAHPGLAMVRLHRLEYRHQHARLRHLDVGLVDGVAALVAEGVEAPLGVLVQRHLQVLELRRKQCGRHPHGVLDARLRLGLGLAAGPGAVLAILQEGDKGLDAVKVELVSVSS